MAYDWLSNLQCTGMGGLSLAFGTYNEWDSESYVSLARLLRYLLDSAKLYLGLSISNVVSSRVMMHDRLLGDRSLYTVGLIAYTVAGLLLDSLLYV